MPPCAGSRMRLPYCVVHAVPLLRGACGSPTVVTLNGFYCGQAMVAPFAMGGLARISHIEIAPAMPTCAGFREHR